MDKKKTGSYYTPKVIADFLVEYLAEKLSKRTSISILEPSAGDGIFIKAIYNHPNLSKHVKNVLAVEKSKRELNKIGKVITNKTYKGIHSDFLKFQRDYKKRFELIIGNPPYIKKNFLNDEQLKYCKVIHKSANLSDNKPKNIWTSFLVRCIGLTEDDGILAFVLPSELLQVKFASELRELILKEFERVEIFTFNELIFKECKGQDTVLLIGERKSKQKGVYYCNIGKLTDLSKRNFSLAQNVNIRESKWTHHHLSTDEIVLLEKIRKQLKVVNDYCSSKAGIVTAANDYFIVDKNTVQEYSLEKFVKPIIQKGIFVNGSVILTDKDFNALVDSEKPAYLVSLDATTKFHKRQRISLYLNLGIAKEIDKRYKTSIRDKWFEVPNIGTPPEAFFFKRCNEYPKLIKNNADVLATDSAYKIAMSEGHKIEDLIFSFYNSVTLSFAELHGRYYGGGVLELTPNEFKNLPVPFVNVGKRDFNSFVKDFRSKTSIKDICKRNDEMILKSIDKNIDSDSIQKLFNIREKLYLHRIKTN